MLGIPLGFITANFIEWGFHKYVLHGLGKNKDSFWSFHWHKHHKLARKHRMLDAEYQNFTALQLLLSPEALSLIGGGTILLPVAKKFPWFVSTMWLCAGAYYGLHYWSHTHPEFAFKWLPHHVRHHLSHNQDMNFCVTVPLADWVLGTAS